MIHPRIDAAERAVSRFVARYWWAVGLIIGVLAVVLIMAAP